MINVATVVLIREKNGDEVSVELFRSQINFTWPNFPISSFNYHRLFKECMENWSSFMIASLSSSKIYKDRLRLYESVIFT